MKRVIEIRADNPRLRTLVRIEVVSRGRRDDAMTRDEVNSVVEFLGARAMAANQDAPFLHVALPAQDVR